MAAPEEAMAEMVEMIEALNQRLVAVEVESLRRNDERALEVAAMTATKEAADAAVEQSKVSEIATINLMSMLEEKVALTKSELLSQQEVVDLKIARYDARLTALIDNVKDNARGIIEDILEEKEQKTGEKKDWKREIMESKAIGQIDRLADGQKYRQWLSKFKNLFDQARRGGRVCIAFLETLTEMEVVEPEPAQQVVHIVPDFDANKFETTTCSSKAHEACLSRMLKACFPGLGVISFERLYRTSQPVKDITRESILMRDHILLPDAVATKVLASILCCPSLTGLMHVKTDWLDACEN